jgi:membrane protein implicated in regulation of membrane protease activity
VSQTIKAGEYGRVAIDGDDWKAESVESEDIPVGSKVEVLDRKSLILTVKTI